MTKNVNYFMSCFIYYTSLSVRIWTINVLLQIIVLHLAGNLSGEARNVTMGTLARLCLLRALVQCETLQMVGLYLRLSSSSYHHHHHPSQSCVLMGAYVRRTARVIWLIRIEHNLNPVSKHTNFYLDM